MESIEPPQTGKEIFKTLEMNARCLVGHYSVIMGKHVYTRLYNYKDLPCDKLTCHDFCNHRIMVMCQLVGMMIKKKVEQNQSGFFHRIYLTRKDFKI